MSWTATHANVSASATSVTLFAARESVALRTVFNDSTATLYLAVGTADASSTNYWRQVPPGGYFEFPQPRADEVVNGVWSSATGTARTMEMG